MQIARVIGSTVATIKDEKLTGRKLMIVREADETGKETGKPYVAVDTDLRRLRDAHSCIG